MTDYNRLIDAARDVRDIHKHCSPSACAARSTADKTLRLADALDAERPRMEEYIGDDLAIPASVG